MEGKPWVALPFGTDKETVSAVVPCTGYPTPGIVNAATGALIDADVFGKVDDANLALWLAAI
jgi:hypothetical protein